jgi:hypothetical protein
MKTNPGSTTLLIQITNHKKNKKHPQIPIHITLTKITKKRKEKKEEVKKNPGFLVFFVVCDLNEKCC